MGKHAPSPVIGYKNYAGAVLVLAQLVHKIKKIKIGDFDAWTGNVSTSGPIEIDMPKLYGAGGAEGGFVGTLNFQQGLPDQLPNDYLLSVLGPDISASRGVSQLVAEHAYWGNNPYLKNVEVLGERIDLLADGSPQWYAEKAPIGSAWLTDQAIYFALDKSDSMGEIETNGLTRLANMKTAINSVLDFIEASAAISPEKTVDLMICAFWNGRSTLTKRAASPTDFTALRTFVSGLSHTFGTDFEQAVTDAPAFFSGAPAGAQRTCIFVTDGLPTRTGTGSDLPPSYYTDSQTITDTALGILNSISDLKTYAFNIDLSDTHFTSQIDNTPVDGVPVVSGSDPSAMTLPIVEALQGFFDINPAHLIRECLTNREWGKGYDEADIDDTAFMAAADRLYAEGFGVGYLWDDDSTTLDDIIDKATSIIDGNLYVDRDTLLWTLTLVRADYDPSTLIELRIDYEISSISNYSRPEFLELVNSVVIQYYNSDNDGNGTLTASNPALFLQQGVKVSITKNYELCSNSRLAAILGQRELNVASQPLASCQLTVNSAAKHLKRGSVFKLTSLRHNFNQTIMRVTSIQRGDNTTKQIKLNVVEDRFAMPQTAIIVTPPPPPPDSSNDPAAVVSRTVMEVPYALLLAHESQTSIDSGLATDSAMGFLGVVGAPVKGQLNADIYVDAGAGFEDAAQLDFCPYGELAADVSYLDTTFTLQNISVTSLKLVKPGDVFLIDSEFCCYTGSISPSSASGIQRGVYDSVPAKHLAGAKIYFVTNYVDGPTTQYEAGESVDVKLLTNASNGTLPLSAAPTDTVVFDSRAIRPYPPGNLKINVTAYPATVAGTFDVHWASRNRVSQANVIVPTTQTDVTAELTTRYGLRFLRNDTHALLVEKTDISGGLATVVLNYTGDVEMQLYSITDNGESYYRHSYIFAYTPPGGTVVSTITAPTYDSTPAVYILDGGGA